MLRGLALAVGWLGAAAFVAFGAAGLTDAMAHLPGSPARSELTFAGDAMLRPRLAAAREDLQEVAAATDRLGRSARDALAALAANDTKTLAHAIDEGTSLALVAVSGAAGLATQLTALPGGGQHEELRFSATTLHLRDALVAALEGTTGLTDAWQQLSEGTAAASSLTGLLLDHDASTARAAELGRGAKYGAALEQLVGSAEILDAAAKARDAVARTSDVTLLTEWLTRSQRYDAALVSLYTALRDSGGRVTAAVRAAVEEEQAARAVLPADTRALTIIISELARGGMNQAVIEIEQARGRIFTALDAIAAEAGGSAGASPAP